MAKSYWLVKQEPTKYPFAQLVKDKTTRWEGARNYHARNPGALRQLHVRTLVPSPNESQPPASPGRVGAPPESSSP